MIYTFSIVQFSIPPFSTVEFCFNSCLSVCQKREFMLAASQSGLFPVFFSQHCALPNTCARMHFSLLYITIYQKASTRRHIFFWLIQSIIFHSLITMNEWGEMTAQEQTGKPNYLLQGFGHKKQPISRIFCFLNQKKIRQLRNFEIR